MREPFLINPRERIEVPKGLFSRPGIGSILKSLSGVKAGSKKAFSFRSALRRKGFNLSDKKTWGKSFVAKAVKKSKKRRSKTTTKLPKLFLGSKKESSKTAIKLLTKPSRRSEKKSSKRKLTSNFPKRILGKVMNPLLIAGANPFKMKGGDICMAKKRRKHNPAKKSHKRRFRRNPAGFFSGSVLGNPKALMTPIAIGIGAKIATDRVPGFIGITDPLTKSGVQVGVAIGGSLLVGKFVSKEAALMWLVVAMSTALSNLANHFMLDSVLGPVLGAYPSYSMGRFLPRTVEPRMLPASRKALSVGGIGRNVGEPVGYPFSNET